MSLRARLFWSYAGLALAAVLLFGALAHQQAEITADQRELVLVRDDAAHLARQFALLLHEGMPVSAALHQFREYGERGWMVQVQALGGVALSRVPAGASLPRNLPPLTDPVERAGHVTQDGRRYAWATQESVTADHHVRLLQPSPRGTAGLMHGPLGRLALAAGVVLLLAGAAALLLSHRIARGCHAETAALTHRALHDSLTGLPNRTLLFDRLTHTLDEAHRHGNPVGLFILDLDRFKEVNDTLGHHSGDLLLKTVGERVSGLLRRSDTIARLGGDEFAILLPHTPLGRAQRCAEKIIDCLETPIPTAGVDLDIDVSIGIAMYPDHGTDAETLLQHADVAMYKAKEHNLGYAIYEPREDRHSVRRLTLMAELRAAIENHQLELHYQPKLDLRSRKVVGVEALLRWRHPDYGSVPPDEFIPLTEQSGLIFPLTDWVLREALRQCELWHQQGLQLQVAVNLSTCSLQDAQCASKIANLLSKRLVMAKQLVLEITESAMMTDVNRAMDAASALDAIGVCLSIDDFGTGFSSLSHLKRLPVDELKIDRSFVQDMAQDQSDIILIQSIIDLAHNMDLRVVAEGVESAAAIEILDRLGCDIVQGFFISRPLPAREFEAWLRHSVWPKEAADENLDPDLVLAT